MKQPEPLKDKISKACDVDSMLDVCRVIHILSAVEWLKAKRMVTTYNEKKYWMFKKEDFYKAFQDVVQNHKTRR